MVALSAQVSKFEKDMQKAGSIADRQVSSIEDRFAQLNPTIGGLTALIPVAVIAGASSAIGLASVPPAERPAEER